MLEGEDEGAFIGEIDGELEGLSMGELDGLREGGSIGEREGDVEGEDDGWVGELVGARLPTIVFQEGWEGIDMKGWRKEKRKKKETLTAIRFENGVELGRIISSKVKNLVSRWIVYGSSVEFIVKTPSYVHFC